MKNNLKVYRAMTNMTQAELAQRSGTTRQTIVAVENDLRDPSLDLTFRLSRIFKIRVEELFLYETTKK
ncbi:MAG: helix-turn-helix transcriptional regulator [Methanomassiliicoccales archaeon]